MGAFSSYGRLECVRARAVLRDLCTLHKNLLETLCKITT